MEKTIGFSGGVATLLYMWLYGEGVQTTDVASLLKEGGFASLFITAATAVITPVAERPGRALLEALTSWITVLRVRSGEAKEGVKEEAVHDHTV